jgi:uncharacterized protein
MSDPAVSNDVRVERNDERRRFEAWIGEDLAGVAEYVARGENVVIFTHTEVKDEFEGQGVGSRLAAGALDQVRTAGKHVQATCTFMGRYIREHDEYADLVDPDGPPLAGGQ